MITRHKMELYKKIQKKALIKSRREHKKQFLVQTVVEANRIAEEKRDAHLGNEIALAS